MYMYVKFTLNIKNVVDRNFLHVSLTGGRRGQNQNWTANHVQRTERKRTSLAWSRLMVSYSATAIWRNYAQAQYHVSQITQSELQTLMWRHKSCLSKASSFMIKGVIASSKNWKLSSKHDLVFPLNLPVYPVAALGQGCPRNQPSV